ncbi:MAG: hypothetical protein AAF628_03455 [Planctomycetota bacterium]
MNSNPAPNDATNTLPPIVEDLFLTEAFLIKGRIARKYQRLTAMLEDTERTYIPIEDATMVSLRGQEVIRTPSVLVNRSEIVFAHELVDTASDQGMKRLANNEKPIRIRAFYSGHVQLELAGMVEPGAYEPQHGGRRWYFVMQKPTIRGLNLDDNPDLAILKDLPYIIVRKSKLAYIYDFSEGK